VTQVVWLEPVADALRELPLGHQELILRKTQLLRRFPRMYRKIGKGRFRNHRRFLAGDWVVYYRVVEDVVYIRGLWPARIP
jgi:mRNA-degrading endonuclease RelE of RelBE toxin-antitoxin system